MFNANTVGNKTAFEVLGTVAVALSPVRKLLIQFSASLMVSNLNRFFSDHLIMEGDTPHTCYGADQHEFCDKNAIFAVFLT
ncbi:hypothetical protein WKI72_19965 [Candidatus Erwinia dacicola]